MKILIWSVAEACNLRCKGCNAWQKRNFFDISNLNSFVNELKKNRVKIVSVTGGEPTLHPNIVEIVKKLKENGIWVHIATNGSLPQRIKKILPYIDAATVSLDSDKREEHNEYRGVDIYDRVIESIKLLRGKVKVLTANMLVTGFNYNRVGEIAKFFNESLRVPLTMCYPEFEGYVYEPLDVTKDEILKAFKYAYENYNGHIFGNLRTYYGEVVRYLKGEKTYPCRAGKVVFYADYEGNVKPCFMKDVILNDDGKIWKDYENRCNDCMIECFREPSIPKNFEKAMLIYKIWRFTHQR